MDLPFQDIFIVGESFDVLCFISISEKNELSGSADLRFYKGQCITYYRKSR